MPRDLAGPRPRARRRPLRDGLPLRPQPRFACEPAAVDARQITAAGKHVVVIGGGDTGADCVGNSIREGAESVVQLELLPEPPAHRPDDRTPWPLWPQKYRLSYAMEEARTVDKGEQDFSITTTHLSRRGRQRHDSARRRRPRLRRRSRPVEGTEFEIKADLVLLAMGFLHPEQELLDAGRRREGPARQHQGRPPYTTSVPGVFAAGDARRGQSLIVWAINEGRQCARMVDRYLGGLATTCPTRTPTRGPRAPRRTRTARWRRDGAVALRLTTDDVGAAERFSYWRELICDTFVGLDAERPGRGFTGTLESARLGPLRLTEVRSVAQHVVRSPRQIERGIR